MPAVPDEVLSIEIIYHDGEDGGTGLENTANFIFRKGSLRIFVTSDYPVDAPEVFAINADNVGGFVTGTPRTVLGSGAMTAGAVCATGKNVFLYLLAIFNMVASGEVGTDKAGMKAVVSLAKIHTSFAMGETVV